MNTTAKWLIAGAVAVLLALGALRWDARRQAERDARVAAADAVAAQAVQQALKLRRESAQKDSAYRAAVADAAAANARSAALRRQHDALPPVVPVDSNHVAIGHDTLMIPPLILARLALDEQTVAAQTVTIDAQQRALFKADTAMTVLRAALFAADTLDHARIAQIAALTAKDRCRVLGLLPCPSRTVAGITGALAAAVVVVIVRR